MAHVQVPNQTPTKAGKRKREVSLDSELSLPPLSRQAVINPHSYPPAKLAQFAVAGLTDADEDPSESIKDFPHRGFAHTQADEQALESDYETGLEEDTDNDGNGDDDGDSDGDSDGDKAKAPHWRKPERPLNEQQKQFRVLVSSTYQLLTQGEVIKAARAFGLAMQLRPLHGRPADIRRYGLWELGGEIIMRKGEEQRRAERQAREEGQDATAAGDAASDDASWRWGLAANMDKLRAYYETLIRQYPPSNKEKEKKRASALHFYISLYSCEIYNAYHEHVAGLAAAGLRASSADEESLLLDEHYGMPLEALPEDESFHTPLRNELPSRARAQGEVQNPKERVRLRTQDIMKKIMARMDTVMREHPYDKNHKLLRLRAVASLFAADLVIPFRDDAAEGAAAAALPELHPVDEQRRRDEIATAKRALRKILESGKDLSAALRALVESDDEDQSLPVESQIYSVLPIRGA